MHETNKYVNLCGIRITNIRVNRNCFSEYGYFLEMTLKKIHSKTHGWANSEQGIQYSSRNNVLLQIFDRIIAILNGVQKMEYFEILVINCPYVSTTIIYPMTRHSISGFEMEIVAYFFIFIFSKSTHKKYSLRMTFLSIWIYVSIPSTIRL